MDPVQGGGPLTPGPCFGHMFCPHIKAISKSEPERRGHSSLVLCHTFHITSAPHSPQIHKFLNEFFF